MTDTDSMIPEQITIDDFQISGQISIDDILSNSDNLV